MQAKDIPDALFLEYLATLQGHWTMLWGDNSVSTWVDGKLVERKDLFPLGTPHKVVRAKVRSLVRRKLMGGCDCGCRGDFEITDKGLALIGKPRVTEYSGY